MARRHRKIRKLRGSRTCGWGITGQHRAGGMRGGHGKAGIHKHRLIPFAPKFAGRTGFKPPSSLRKEPKTINVGELDELTSNLTANKKLTQEKGRTTVNLVELGYSKLLGGGRVTQPLIVKVPSFSESAAKKIKEAGGEIAKPA